MSISEHAIEDVIAQSNSRFDLWVHFINLNQIQHMAEIGVYRGDFAAKMLKECPSLKKYYMIDPWRHLDDWNKPANKSDALFEQFFSEAKAKTDFAAEKRIILRGTTTEVIDEIPDGALDFAYIDGDHTLRGITIDLIRVYPKIREGGWLAGDDFSQTIWQHNTNFEPTLVFPFAVYFAEAVGARIYALPYSQFLLEKQRGQAFSFIDFTGQYHTLSLREQFLPRKLLALKISKAFPLTRKMAKRMKNRIHNKKKRHL